MCGGGVQRRGSFELKGIRGRGLGHKVKYGWGGEKVDILCGDGMCVEGGGGDLSLVNFHTPCFLALVEKGGSLERSRRGCDSGA